MPPILVHPQQVFARIGLATGFLGDSFHRKRSLAPLVSALGGVRGDRLDQVHLALAARLPGYKPAALLRELQERHTLVRTWAMRGSLHVVATAELPEFLAVAGLAPRWKRYLESRSSMTPQARLRLLHRLCPDIVSREALREAFPDASMRQFLLRELAQAGHILWVEGDGAGARFGWTRKILGRAVEPARDFRDLIRRYLQAYAPLHAADLASWLGVTVAAARQLMAKHRVVEVQIEGEEQTAFMRPDEIEATRAVRKRDAKGLVVLPPGDPFVLAYKTRYREEGGDDVPGLAFLDGRLVARWSLTRSEASVAVLEPAVEKKVTGAVRSLLERAGVEAALVPAGT